MRHLVLGLCGAAVVLAVAAAACAEPTFEISPAVQAELERQKTVVAGWAAAPEIVQAVKQQNARGPLAGMDNARWKTTRAGDLTVRGFQMNQAGRFLKRRLQEGGGAYAEAFLSAGQGEKVAFVEKTTSYVHKGSAKFDVPFESGKSWQGKPELDDSSLMFTVQISVPVLDEGKRIGVLVVGVNVSHLERTSKR